MTTVTIDVRRADPEDAAEIAAIHHEAWQGAYCGIIPHRALASMINRRGPDWWASAIKRAASVLVIEVGGRIAGYATIGRSRSRDLKQQGEIYELYVKPEYQGTGLGTRLFAAARDRLSGHGLKGLVVWALEDNETATTFYHGMGGRDIAEGVEIFDQKALRKVAFVWA